MRATGSTPIQDGLPPTQALVEVIGLKMHFCQRGWLQSTGGSTIRAVDGVTLAILPESSVGLVGESGSGKSTLGKCIMRIHEPTGGRVLFAGTDITHLPHGRLTALYADMQMVFQNPYSSLDPRMRIKDIVAEPWLLHRRGPSKDRQERVREMLSLVGLSWDIAYRMPFELSGGQRQRVAIARALMLEPKLVILDEPTSSLDVSVQAQILNLVTDLQQRLGFSCLFISHDLSVIRHVCTRVGVMYLGAIVELGSREQIFDTPLHPYTQALLSASPEPDPDYQGDEIAIEGEIGAVHEQPGVCRFAPRCFARMAECFERSEPALKETAPGHFVACLLH